VRRALTHWGQDPARGALRDKAELARLPEAERMFRKRSLGVAMRGLPGGAVVG
jgi:hypothetical protein